jgi:hypothetical protein
MISLYELLYSPEREDLKRSLDAKEKSKICLEIAKILSTLH